MMVKSKRGGQLWQTAGILMAATIISRFLGYARDIILVSQFGQGALTDAYYAAFTLPDFLYTLVVGGALGPAFIPVFSSYLAEKKEAEGWVVANSILNIVLILMGLGTLLGWIFAPLLISILVPGFPPEMVDLTVSMTRIMFAQSLFMALAGLAMGVLNGHNHFLASSLGSVVYNLGLVVLGIALAPRFGIVGFALAVVGGSICYLLVQLPALYNLGWRYQRILAVNHPGVRKIGSMLLPILLGLSVSQLNFLVNQNLASGLETGILTALRMAQRLMQLPIGIFAITIAIAIFPTMTRQASSHDQTGYKGSLVMGLRSIWFLSLPATIGMVVLREPLIALLYAQGAFTQESIVQTADCLLFYCIGLFAYASLHLLNRAFYALQDTKTPMAIGAASIVVNIGLSVWLVSPWEHYGLALAYSIAGIFNMGLLLWVLRKRVGPFGGRKLLQSFGKNTLCALFMGGIVYLSLYLVIWLGVDGSNKFGQLLQISVGTISGVLSYFLLAKMAMKEELQRILAKKR